MNEHFGIEIVEYMAAGLLTFANRSGGPLLDIIETSGPDGSQTGFMAEDDINYPNAIVNILYSTKEQNDVIRNAAR